MKNIWIIMKKELRRFFTDRRMLLSLILPGVLIFVIYSLMGDFITSSFQTDENYEYNVYTLNQPTEYSDLFTNLPYHITVTEIEASEEALTTAKEKLANKEIEIIISYDADFSEKVNANQMPNVSIYYNSSVAESQELYGVLNGLLSMKGSIPVYSVNHNQTDNTDMATKEDTSAMIITMMLPYILIIFLFTGCMAISTESIAGEKERGTIATLLVTPVKRSHIAIGKILSLSITSLVSATVSFIGIVASLPKLMGGAGDLTLDMYNFGTYALMLLVIMVTVILFTVILSILSAFSKSIKEASQLAVPVMVIVMLVGLTSLIGGGNVATNTWLYLIPVYNSVQCMTGILSLHVNALNFGITILSNAVVIGLGIYALAKMFNSEKIMFNK